MTDQIQNDIEREKYIAWKLSRGHSQQAAERTWDGGSTSAQGWQARAALDGGAVSQDHTALIKAVENARNRDQSWEVGKAFSAIADEIIAALRTPPQQPPKLFCDRCDDNDGCREHGCQRPQQQDKARDLHPETAELVDRFAEALKDKLAAAEKKYGYSDGWAWDNWQAELIKKLQHHVVKGDPLDVAAYCAFAWHHGWSITPPQQQDKARDLKLGCFFAKKQADALLPERQAYTPIDYDAVYAQFLVAEKGE